jgi:hypothetical protein
MQLILYYSGVESYIRDGLSHLFSPLRLSRLLQSLFLGDNLLGLSLTILTDHFA